MKPTSGRKIIVDHFKGIHDFPPPGKLYPDFSPQSMGVMDLMGGNLNRVGGAIQADSISRPSVWSLGQLRFRDDWSVITGGNQRECYSPGPPYINGVIDFNSSNGTEDDVKVREDTENGGTDEEGKPNDPIDPEVCHSYWSVLPGIFSRELSNVKIYTTRSTPGFRTYYGDYATVPPCQMVAIGYNLWRAHYDARFDGTYPGPGGAYWRPTWEDWDSLSNPWILDVPDLSFGIRWDGLNVSPYQWRFLCYYKEVAFAFRCNQLANPPPPPGGLSWEKATAYVWLNAMPYYYTWDVTSYIGNPNAGTAAWPIGTKVDDDYPEMPILYAGVGTGSANHTLAHFQGFEQLFNTQWYDPWGAYGGIVNCLGIPLPPGVYVRYDCLYEFAYNCYNSSQMNTTRGIILETGEGGVMQFHESHFGGG